MRDDFVVYMYWVLYR